MMVIARSVGVVLLCFYGVFIHCQGKNTTTEVAEAPSETPEGVALSPTPAVVPSSPASPRRPERAAVVKPGPWTLIHKGKLVVEPTRLATIFTIPGDYRMHARYQIRFVVPEAPPGCLPNETLWYSPAAYFKELCIERDWMGKCTLPGPDGFQSTDDLVRQYPRLKQVLFDYKWEKPRQTKSIHYHPPPPKKTVMEKTLEGDFCYKDRDYWISFSTSCTNTTEIEIEVGVQHLNFFEKWTCRGFDYFVVAQHGSDAFLTSKLFWTIIAPIGYLSFLVCLTMCCCTVFQCGALAHESTVMNVDFGKMFKKLDDDVSKKKHKKKHKRDHSQPESSRPMLAT